MKVCIIQPEYSVDFSRAEELFYKGYIDMLDKCDDTMDIIVMPESCDMPALCKTVEQKNECVDRFNKIFVDKICETAKRCNALVFANARWDSGKGYVNTTYAVDRGGNIVYKYFKQHPVPKEVASPEQDTDNAFQFTEPDVVEIEGIRFGFLTCYDFYFYEMFANMARKNLDVVIGCSHQRSDTHRALEIFSTFLAYNTNTYVLRSSVSMDPNSDIGGGSMVVAPTGEVLLNMKSRIGMECVDIDVTKKYYKPAGFGNPPAAHYEYIEQGRKPWKYRPGGSAICLNDTDMPYPRVCAHRGFNSVAPENSLPAFGAAIGLGAEEIEFDLWPTADGEIISLHDKTLERVSDGEGKVTEKTYEELLNYDFGSKKGEKFKGLKILKFEEILKKFSCHCIMNIHIKSICGNPDNLKKIIDLIDKYDCRKHVYFMTGDDDLMELCREMAPDICRCMGGGSVEKRWAIVERAILHDCQKVQLFKPYFNQEMIDKAHANGIKCNVFWSDDQEETKKFIEMGIDCILTNDYNLISQVVER
ncbi:MAG: hypothetical protein IJA41_05215 [Clostridia bacterium]|nr:hypothetical protein [Clostridia bacterium]